jgi:hypothetical protein
VKAVRELHSRMSEPWNGIRPDEIADYSDESRHTEDGGREQGGAHGSILLQEPSVDGLQPLLHVGPIAILSFMVPRFGESYHPRARVKTAAQFRRTRSMERRRTDAVILAPKQASARANTRERLTSDPARNSGHV